MEHVANGYRNFAAHEAPGRSSLYAELAAGVAEDAEICAGSTACRPASASRTCCSPRTALLAGTPAGWPEFRTLLGERRDEIEALMLERRTQTNEAARCALMLPLLAALPQPLALLEVGASAGLCLLPDRYGYDYAGHRLGEGSPMLRCSPKATRRSPTRCPRSSGAPGSTSTRSTSPTPSRCAGSNC